MITVTFFYSGDEMTGFESRGHADYAEEGYDIVCSAVSALTFNTVNSIEAFTQDGFDGEQDPDGGYLKLTMKPGFSSESELLLKSLELGLKGITETYGEKFLRIVSKDAPMREKRQSNHS